MRHLLSVVCLAVLIVKAYSAFTSYTTKYDNIDLDEILKSDRLLQNYVDCLMEKKPCPPDGAELKRTLPDAIETGCSKCNEKQRNGTKKVMHYLIDHRPALWGPLEKKYDPSGNYRKKYLDKM